MSRIPAPREIPPPGGSPEPTCPPRGTLVTGENEGSGVFALVPAGISGPVPFGLEMAGRGGGFLLNPAPVEGAHGVPGAEI